jgi:hypothetical protein
MAESRVSLCIMAGLNSKYYRRYNFVGFRQPELADSDNSRPILINDNEQFRAWAVTLNAASNMFFIHNLIQKYELWFLYGLDILYKSLNYKHFKMAAIHSIFLI